MILMLSVATLFGQSPVFEEELKAAAKAERLGQYDQAAIHYERCLSGAKPSRTAPSALAHVRTRLAKAYFLLHRYRESLEALAPLTSKSPRSDRVPAQAWLVEGLDYLALNQPQEAVSSLRRALAGNPSSGTARLALGDALARTGQWEEGVQRYEEQTRRTPSVVDAWYKLGLAFAELARQVARRFAQDHAESIVGQQLLAEESLSKGDYWGAARTLFPLLRRASSQPELRADLGIALMELGYVQAAAKEFEDELAWNPESPAAMFGLAEVAGLLGDWKRALAQLDQLVRNHPGELARRLESAPSMPLRQAWLEHRIGLPASFRASYTGHLWEIWLAGSAAKTEPPPTMRGSCSDPSPDAMSTPGLWLSTACYERLRSRLRARKDLSLGERMKLAEADFRLGHYQSARRNSQRVLASDSGNEWGIYWLSKSYAALADECFVKIASLNPESVRVHQMLARHYADRYNFARAKAEYKSALSSDPDLPDLHLQLGTVYWQGGEWQEAEEELQKTLELSPGSAVAQYELGDTYVQQRRWQLGVDHLRKALGERSVALKARLDLAKCEAELGQTGQALEDLKAVASQDRDGEIHYRLATLYRKLGDMAQARAALATSEKLRAASLQVNREQLEALEREREAIQQFDH